MKLIILVGVVLGAAFLPIVTVAQSEDPADERASWLRQRAGLGSADQIGGPLPQGEIGGVAGPREDSAGEEDSGRGVVLPILMSAILPGAGEAYLGHVRGYPMMALDIGVWLGVKHYHDLGYEWEEKFMAFADEHWSEERLSWAYMSDDEFADEYWLGEGRKYFDVPDNPTGYLHLPLWVSRQADEREYFENLGKWDQFVFGWDDFTRPQELDGYIESDPLPLSNLSLRGISDNRDKYVAMRIKSNDQFTNRDRLVYLNLAMRVFSIFQVAYLEGLLGGGPKPDTEVAGNSVSFFADTHGLTSTRIGLTVSY